MEHTGIIKEASLDFLAYRHRSKVFNELKKVLLTSIQLLHRPNPELRVKGLNQIHEVISKLTKDGTSISKLAFEATQLDDQLCLTYNLCNLLETNPPCETLGPEVKHFWLEQTEKCLLILQGIACFCPETSEYFLELGNFKVLINLIKCKDTRIALNALETTQCILATSPEHLRIFEEAGGLSEVMHLTKQKQCAKELRWKTLEFLFFYLLPEVEISEQGTMHFESDIIKSSLEKRRYVAQLLGEFFVDDLQRVFGV